MSYEVGTYIDLSHLNKRQVPTVQKKSNFQEAANTLFEVGTQFIIKQGKLARRIPVVTA